VFLDQILVMGGSFVFGTIAIDPLAQIAQIVLAHRSATQLLGARAIDKLAKPDFPLDVGSDCIFKVH
jgi:hypothetical protein